MVPTKWQKRVDSGDWEAITAEVNDFGGALLPRLLTTSEAEAIRGRYPGSAKASTGISGGRIPSRSNHSRRPCIRGCCRSPGNGGPNWAGLAVAR
jgi:hypothetical protein